MISIISCSHRIKSQSVKVATYCKNVFDVKNVSSNVIDLAEVDLPFKLSETDKSTDTSKLKSTVGGQLRDSEGFVFVVPEWNGTFTPMLSNFLLHFSAKEFAHKPVLIVTVSSGRGGALIVSQIRSMGYKNTLLNYIPEHVIIRDVESYCNVEFNSQEYESMAYVEQRLEFALTMLQQYAIALSSMRAGIGSENLFFHHTSNGMS